MTSAQYVPPAGTVPDTVDPASESTASIPVELAELRQRPLAEHATAFERIHERLTSSLAAIDTA